MLYCSEVNSISLPSVRVVCEGDLQEAGSDRLAVFPVMIACE